MKLSELHSKMNGGKRRLKPKKGTAVFFPSSYTHTHRGNPPLSNTKYIATGWYSVV